MNKELEKNHMTHQEAIDTIKNNYPPANYTMLREALDLCIDMLTPPTEDEMCEALQNYFNTTLDIYYSKDERGFFYTSNNIKAYIIYELNSGVKINFPFPPHIITLIGEFYKGVKL